MLRLIKINLLPYREALIQQQKQQFIRLMILSALLGAMLSVLVYITLSGRVSMHESRNETLNGGIKQMDTQIESIQKLQQERDNFLSRKQKVEELEERRFQAARLLDTLNILAPDGLYLTSIESNDKNADGKDTGTYVINGKAISDGKIAMFMRNIPTTGFFGTPELVSIKRNNDAQEFSLNVRMNRGMGTMPPSAAEININEPMASEPIQPTSADTDTTDSASATH